MTLLCIFDYTFYFRFTTMSNSQRNANAALRNQLLFFLNEVKAWRSTPRKLRWPPFCTLRLMSCAVACPNKSQVSFNIESRFFSVTERSIWFGSTKPIESARDGGARFGADFVPFRFQTVSASYVPGQFGSGTTWVLCQFFTSSEWNKGPAVAVIRAVP